MPRKQKKIYEAQAELVSRLKQIHLPTGGQWYHSGRAVPKPINPRDDIAVLAGKDCWLVSQGTSTAKVDNKSGEVYFTDRASWSDEDCWQFAQNCFRHLPA